MRLLLVLGILSVSLHAARGQAWPQPDGGLYVKLSHGRTTAAEQYTFDGSVKPYADSVVDEAFFDRSFYGYAEFGLTPRLTVVGLVPIKRLRVLDAAFAYESGGLGSVMLGVRYGLHELLGWPAGKQALALNAAAYLPAGYTRNYAPSIGAGQADLQTTLDWGLSLYPLPGYAQLGAGYRYRSTWYALSRRTDCQPGRDVDCVRDARPHFDDEWIGTAEAGASLGRWALLQVLGRAVISTRAPDATSSFTANNPIPTRQRYLKVGVGVTLYPIRSLGLSVQAFGTAYGRNTIRSSDFFFGLEYIRR